MRENEKYINTKRVILFFVFIIALAVGLSDFDITKATSPALNFNGTSNYVLIPSINAGSVFSVEAWFNFEDFTALTTQITLFKDSYVNGSFGSIYLSGENGINFDVEWWFNRDYRLGVSGPNKQTWYHLVFVSDGVSVRIYIDGTLRTTGDYAISFNNDLEVGTGDGAGYWKGMVDEIRIYNRALSASEVLAHYQGTFSNESGLKGLWHFNEGTGGIAADSSGNGNDAIIYGATWTTWAGPPQPAVVAQPVSTQSFIVNHPPNIKLMTFLGEAYLNGKTNVMYEAYDNDPAPYNLGNTPISVYYSNNIGVSWKKLADGLSNNGKYIFNTADLPDGNSYMLKLAVTDNTDIIGDIMSNRFSIDNTGPSFEVSIVRTSTIKENDNITFKIISSEGLAQLPEVQISQQGADPKKIIVTGSGLNFIGSYKVEKGFLGAAVFSVKGQDLAGNIGDTILTGKTFLVDRLGPPPPTVDNPLNNSSLNSPDINVKGKAPLAKEVIFLLNGITKLSAKPSDNGDFIFAGITLSAANKGHNIIAVSSIDKDGLQSDEKIVKVKLNNPPEISFSPKLQGALFGKVELGWLANDYNDDRLSYSIMYSTDGGKNWENLAENFAEQKYQLDTSGFFDGDEYRFKITVNDGTVETSAISDKVGIKNNISFSISNAPPDYKFNSALPMFEGIIKLSENSISLLRYSFNKKDWFSAEAADGRLDSLSEKFLIRTPSQLIDGRHILFIELKDTRDNIIRTFKSFIVDTVPPQPPKINYPSAEAIVSSNDDLDRELGGIQINITGKTEAGANLDLIVNDRVYAAIADSNGEFIFKKVNLLGHGVNRYLLSNFDAAGNVSKIEGIVISNNPPKITLLAPEEGDYISKIKEIAWSVSDIDDSQINYKILYRPTNGKWVILVENFTKNSFKWDVSKYGAGEYDLKLVGNDGLSDVTAAVEGIFIDNDPPQIILDSIDNTLINNTRPFFSGKATDKLSRIAHVEYSFDGVNWHKALFREGYKSVSVSFEFYNQTPLVDGNYKMRMRATDAAGNVAYSEPVALTIDTSAPTIGSGLISSGALMLFPDLNGRVKLFKDRPYKIVMSVSGDASEVSLKIGKMNFDLNFNKSTALWEGEVLLKESGEHPLEVFSKDKAGNSKSRKILNLEVIPLGYIYNKENSDRIARAKIILYIFDEKSNSWLVWDGGAFNQRNPEETNSAGEYEFLVPPGIYRLEVKANGFENFKSNDIKAAKNYLINLKIQLTEKKGFFNKFIRFFKK